MIASSQPVRDGDSGEAATRKREARFRRWAVTSNADQLYLLRGANFESLMAEALFF